MTDARDEALARLLGDLTDALKRGESPDLDAVARDHPDLADELRDLWAAVTLAEDLARVDPSDETAIWPPPAATTHASPAVGAFGGCELLEELGRGGMGVVYRARQVGLGRIVALKRLLREEAALPHEVARFRQEAEAAATLDHPHIVPVFVVDQADGHPYFLMKYVEGTTLARRLAEGPLSPREAAALLAPVCRAIDYAHRRGVLHRDLKPSNILLDGDGRPHVSDFGLAKRLDGDGSLTQSGAILGTPSFMAPEQASTGRGPVGPASDVYSLGAILYQMLTGRPPFQAASAVETLLLVLDQDPLPPRALNPQADADLEMVALKCLQKAPELRYPSAAALADDLEAYLAGEPVAARSASLRGLVSRLWGETHHAHVLENWGTIWIGHSLALLVFFGTTNVLLLRGVASRWPYFLLFTAGLGLWAEILWETRRRGGPITFAERQLTHVWGAGVVGINMVLAAEWLLGLPTLKLFPLVAVTNGILFVVQAGMISGIFYAYALALFLTMVPMALYPRFAPLMFGTVSALCFLNTGIKYRRRRFPKLPG